MFLVLQLCCAKYFPYFQVARCASPLPSLFANSTSASVFSKRRIAPFISLMSI
jgi:hypothetical protein